MDTAEASSLGNYSHQSSGHRPSTSIYHPQPTRSGRIPVPPPEEELQAMLAMDNYFEFPSESESDDEDFVLPASELNDDDDDQEDDTPRHETQRDRSTTDAVVDQDDENEGILDSAEYDWLMENLNALERTDLAKHVLETPLDTIPLASTSASTIEQRPQTSKGSISAALAAVVADNSTRSTNLGHAANEVSTAIASVTPDSHYDIDVSSASQSNDRPSTDKSRQSVLYYPGPLPKRPTTSSPRLRTTKAAQSTTTSSADPRENSNSAKHRPSRKRKAAVGASEDLASQSEADGASAPTSTTTTAVPLAKLEFKRKRNAEQSRTFRERQRAQKEANERFMRSLQEENSKLRQELSDLRERLEVYEGSHGRPPKAKAPRKSTTSTRRPRNNNVSRSVDTPSETIRETQTPGSAHNPESSATVPVAGALTFEDLGKFVAGLVQAKTQPPSSGTRASSLIEGDSESSTAATCTQQNPLMLLTQLLTSQQ